MKHLRIRKNLLLTLALCAVFLTVGMVRTYAASAMNPMLSVSYKETDGKTTITLSVAAPDEETAAVLERAILDTGKEAFRLDAESDVNEKLTEDAITASRVSTGDRLYKLSLINGEAITEGPENLEMALKYELVPSDEAIKDKIETVDHNNTELVLKDAYFVNDKEVEQTVYEKTLRRKCCFEAEPEKTTDIKEVEPMYEEMSFKGKDAQSVNYWIIDRYYHYEKTSVTNYKLYVLNEKADKVILPLKGSEYSRASYLPLRAKEASTGYTESTLRWTKVEDAYKYIIYRSPCGKGKTNYKRVGDTPDTGYTARKLKKHTYYKYIVVAVSNHGKMLAVSPSVHIATKGGSYANPKNLSLRNKTMRLKRGKSASIQSKINYRNVQVHVDLRYASSDRKVATVSKSGKIKARSKGSCYIYAYAQNGISKRIKVIVK